MQTTIKEVMTTHVLVANKGFTFTEVCRLFFEMGVHHLPIVNKSDQLVGIITSNDVLRAYNFQVPLFKNADEEILNAEILVENIMTKDPITISPDQNIKKAAIKLTQNNIQCLPVVKEGKLVGIITTKDIIRLLAEKELLHY